MDAPHERAPRADLHRRQLSVRPHRKASRLCDARRRPLRHAPEPAMGRPGMSVDSGLGGTHRLPDMIETTVADVSRKVLADLKRTWPAESRRQHEELGGFRKRLHDRWEKPLAGPSNAGLADPGHDAALSLAQVAVAGAASAWERSVEAHVQTFHFCQLRP